MQATECSGGTSGPAGPASGSNASQKYQGFGSQDIARLGYNNQDQFGSTGPYDPYQKSDAASKKKEEKKPHTQVAQFESDDDSSFSSLDSDPDSDDPDVKRKRAKIKKREDKKKAKEAAEKAKAVGEAAPKEPSAGGLGLAPKASREFTATAPAPQAQAPQTGNLLDMLSTPAPAQQ